MSVTEKQKAYHLRKMRTVAKRQDTNNDGYFSVEDFILMADRLIEYGKLPKEQAEVVHKTYMKHAEMLGLKPGVKIPLEEITRNATRVLESTSLDECKAHVCSAHEPLFDVIDLNKDGHIDMEEFKVYYQVIGVTGLSDEEVIQAFKIIDTNKDGVISREEFLAAAVDFHTGVDETELSKVFMGPLED